jgi:serine/threonine protein kinase
MIIYECLTLKQPYEGIPPLQISMKIVAGERPQMTELAEEYRPFIELYHRCTEMEPEDRPTVPAIIKELEALEV